jgi:hypothetical protein
MTKPNSPLSVRLAPALAKALERHCAQTGETRSRVVQQSIAQYLVVQSGRTLGGLAEAVLPPLAAAPPARKTRASRQKRYRNYAREKRRR